MKEKTKANLYREKRKKDGFSERSYSLPKDVIDIVDKIAKKTKLNKSDIVSEAIRKFAKSNYKATAGKKASPVSNSEFNSVKKALTLLVEDHFSAVHEWKKEDVNEGVAALKEYNTPYSKMMTKAFFDKYVKDHPDHFDTHKELQLFLFFNSNRLKKQ